MCRLFTKNTVSRFWYLYNQRQIFKSYPLMYLTYSFRLAIIWILLVKPVVFLYCLLLCWSLTEMMHLFWMYYFSAKFTSHWVCSAFFSYLIYSNFARVELAFLMYLYRLTVFCSHYVSWVVTFHSEKLTFLNLVQACESCKIESNLSKHIFFCVIIWKRLTEFCIVCCSYKSTGLI